jgi:hypothetical protein
MLRILSPDIRHTGFDAQTGRDFLPESVHYSFRGAVPVPEPSSLLILGGGLGVILLFGRRGLRK